MSASNSFSHDDRNQVKVGIVGTGFIGTGLSRLLQNHSALMVSKVLTRRPLKCFSGKELAELVTHSIEQLINESDVIVECSGDALWASIVIEQAFLAGLPVVTMNAEFQIVAGSYYASLGKLHEAEGDQPGSVAKFDEEVRAMGFEPLVYGSQKGFLDTSPSLEEMRYWSGKLGQSLSSTVHFTDGTKVQIEAALIANGLGGGILQKGLMGPSEPNTADGALKLARHASSVRGPISDYVLNPRGRGEVFIVATHDDISSDSLSYFKLGEGPYYYLERPYHLGYFEIIKSIEHVLLDNTKVFNNGRNPKVSVAAVAKRTIRAGEKIQRAFGSFDFIGKAVNIRDYPSHVPMALLAGCEIRHGIEMGEIVEFCHVSMPASLAGEAWQCSLQLAKSAKCADMPDLHVVSAG